MIYLFAALYAEAKPLIRYFGLKKDTNAIGCDEFYSEPERIRLILTGTGSMAAAVLVSHVCTRYAVGREDHLVNLGICAGLSDLGGLFLCNKIIDRMTGRTFYPDILYRHGLPEKAVVTETKTVTDKEVEEDILYDMEAAAIYQTGAYFVSPHQMSFLKMISDHGDISQLSGERISELVQRQMEPIIDYIRMLQDIADGNEHQGDPLEGKNWVWVDRLCDDLHCSQTMRAAVLQLFRYLLLQEEDCRARIEQMYTAGLLPCADRREGKKRFEEITAWLL